MYVVYIFLMDKLAKQNFKKMRVLQLQSCFDVLCISNEIIVINGKEKQKKLCINLRFRIYFSTTFSSIPTLIGRSNVKLRWSESDYIDGFNDKQVMCTNLDRNPTWNSYKTALSNFFCFINPWVCEGVFRTPQRKFF